MFELHANKAASMKNDILSGLTVALALVPEAVAFAFVAGVPPLVGLYAAFMVGLITSVIGGRPGMISGATGALAVVMVSLVAQHGVQYLFTAVVLMGGLQIVAGILKLGKFIRMAPHPVMLGFVNGLAIVIFLAQLGQLGVADQPGWLTGTFIEGSAIDIAWMATADLYPMLGLILLTLRMIDELTETHGCSNRECIGQGVANTVTGCFGGMGGCAMIGQSMINVNSGGRGRLSGIAAALFLLAFILFAAPLIEMIPVAVLIGVMLIVVIGTFEWSSFRILRKIPKGDAFVLILVSIVTVFTDLAMAVVSGVIVSALIFAWAQAKHIRVEQREDHKGATVYMVHGPLFFSSTSEFLRQFSPQDDHQEIIIDFQHSRVCDHSGLDAIDTLAEHYLNAGKQLHLIHLSKDCRNLLKKAGNLVEVNVIEDPKYFVATNA